MAVIHQTTLTPTKLELLTPWLPTRPWYRGSGAPELERTGGFRLDDPEGEVGIEFMVVTDGSTPEPTAYLVPLTYRAAPLAGAEDALIGTAEHGVLGKRWVYDGCHDPVLTTELLALIGGTAQAMAQRVSDTPDHEVTRSYTGEPLPTTAHTPAPADDADGTALPAPHGAVLRVHRVLRPAPEPSPPPAPRARPGMWRPAGPVRTAPGCARSSWSCAPPDPARPDGTGNPHRPSGMPWSNLSLFRQPRPSGRGAVLAQPRPSAAPAHSPSGKRPPSRPHPGRRQRSSV